MIDAAKYALIDIHLHLDGSLSVDDVIHMARLNDIDLPDNREEILHLMQCPANCERLHDYLKCFTLPISVMQNAASIAYSVESLLRRLDQQGLIYAEIRFAPQQHTTGGLTQQEVVEAALEGFRSGLRQCSNGLCANLMLSCMRDTDNEAENIETVRLAKQFMGQGVCGIDLAGSEAANPTANFGFIMKQAAAMGLSITIHAGEAAGVESMTTAMELGATVIGHGIRAWNDEAMKQRLHDEDICLTFCPTSNMQTRALPQLNQNDYSTFPLQTFLDYGVPVCINTDNMTVSNTTLRQEFQCLFDAGVINENQAQQLVFNAITHCFADIDTKAHLLATARQRLR